MHIGLMQIHFRAADVESNTQKIIDLITHYASFDLLIFPELSISGYDAQDHYSHGSFIQACESAWQTILKHATLHRVSIILGNVMQHKGTCYNTTQIALYHAETNTMQTSFYMKSHLPTTDVFDEMRYFRAPSEASSHVVEYQNQTIGFWVCEDLWQASNIQEYALSSLSMMIVINASPFDDTKIQARLSLLKNRAQSLQCPIVYVNTIGGQDDLLFDGMSCVMMPSGECLSAPLWEECVLGIETQSWRITSLQWPMPPRWHTPIFPHRATLIEQIDRGLVRGLSDYFHKHQQTDAIIGLSGGIDSACVLHYAVEALGSDHIEAIFLSSKHTSTLSATLASHVAQQLNVHLYNMPIEPYHQLIESTHQTQRLTDENIQARLRGLLLMMHSNRTGAWVINTSNKSELAMGYGTLYGDLIGAFALIKDVVKTRVYELVQHRDPHAHQIPMALRTRAPTAELRPEQTDQDTLPPYDLIDDFIHRYIEQKHDFLSPNHTEQWMMQALHRSEYKRRQAPIGPKITTSSFDRGWRWPIGMVRKLY